MISEIIMTIYFAGGCFWGVEKYFSQIHGVMETKVGYANGKIVNPTYEQVTTGKTAFTETVEVKYDPAKISLNALLECYFSIIDPTSLNKQGNDAGTQYRTGIYYTNQNDEKVIDDFIVQEQKKYKKPIVVEVEKLKNFYPAEEYHQKYLEKNPHGYCHIKISDTKKYFKPEKDEIKKKLNDTQYKVTQEGATEPPHSSKYNNSFEKGIYVDIVSGEPLFSSKDKFKCGCGWPSFSIPIDKKFLVEKPDNSLGMQRVEVRSKIANSHLGHVFNDGPKEKGGLRYCINGSALKFIPKNELKKEGYGEFLYLFN